MIRSPILRLFLAWTLVAQTLAPVRAETLNLPDLGDASRAAVSPTQEKRLGAEFIRLARQQGAFADDPEIHDYLQTLGQRLTIEAENPGYEFRFYLVNGYDINAFAVPGGHIGINRGLILASQSEAELASVMAHEITHVTQRHIPRMIAESQRVNLPAMAAILAAILLGGSKGAQAGAVITSASVQQHYINYTRSFEEEADRLGMRLLARAGFDPGAMPAFFERMQTLNRVNESNLPEFLRTHPVTSNRIADARGRAEQLPSRPQRDSEDYLNVHARLRALAPGEAAEIARGFRLNLAQEKYRNIHAERYGYALALLRQREFELARAEVDKLVSARPERVYYRILQGRIEMEAQETTAALELFARAYKRAPNHAGLARFYAEALLEAKQPQRAYELLRLAVRTNADDPVLHRLLARAAGDSDHPVEAHRAAAENYYLGGDPMAAVEQLQIARRHACENFYLRASIEARIAALREEAALLSGTSVAPASGRPTDDCKPAQH